MTEAEVKDFKYFILSLSVNFQFQTFLTLSKKINSLRMLALILKSRELEYLFSNFLVARWCENIPKMAPSTMFKLFSSVSIKLPASVAFLAAAFPAAICSVMECFFTIMPC